MSYKDLQNRLGYRFKDEALIELALTHKSFSNISKCYNKSTRCIDFGKSIIF